jgi:hypothetical protein
VSGKAARNRILSLRKELEPAKTAFLRHVMTAFLRHVKTAFLRDVMTESLRQ